MLRVVNTTEKNVHALPPEIVALAAAVAKDVLDSLNQPVLYATKEIAGRYIQNNTGADVYYAFDADANNTNSYHGILADKQQLDCSNHGGRVSCYSVAGGNMITTILIRDDLAPRQCVFPAQH